MRAGPMLAAAGGVVLLVSMFLPWYGFEVSGGAPGVADLASGATVNAWEAFAWADLLLALAAVVAIAWAALGARAPALVRRETVAGAAGLAAGLVVYRLLDLPVPELDTPLVRVSGSREAGGIVALSGTVVIMIGALQQKTTRVA